MSNLTQLHKQKRKGFWKARIYPSGDFTIGKNQPLKGDKGHDPLDGISSHETFYGATKVSVPARAVDVEFDPKSLEKIAITYEQAGNQELADRFADRYASEVLSGNHDVKADPRLASDLDDWEQISPPPMGLSDAINSRSTPSNPLKSSKQSVKRGHRGISSYGKRITRSATAMLEDRFGRECVTFGTATLPFMTTAENDLICQNWGVVTNRFFEKLMRLAKRRGLSGDYCFVSEIQEGRFDKFGIVAPHLHWLMQGKLSKRSHWLILPHEVKEIWESVLGNFLKRSVDGSTATRIEKPKKSLRKEMGKYLSKGNKIIKKIIDSGNGQLLPSAYHGCSSALKKAIKAAIIILQGDEAEEFVDNLEDMKAMGLISFIPILWEIPDSGGKNIKVGFVGWLRDTETVLQCFAA